MLLTYLKIHIMQWLRFQAIKLDVTTAAWVVDESIYQEIDDAKTDAELSAIQDRLDSLRSRWGLDPELARAHSTCAFLKGD